MEISNLQPGHRYKFRVYPKTVINSFISKKEWVFSEKTYEQPPLGTYMHAVIVAHVTSKVPLIFNHTETFKTFLFSQPEPCKYDVWAKQPSDISMAKNTILIGNRRFFNLDHHAEAHPGSYRRVHINGLHTKLNTVRSVLKPLNSRFGCGRCCTPKDENSE